MKFRRQAKNLGKGSQVQIFLNPEPVNLEL